MKKTISAKRVINELLLKYNELSEAQGFYFATNDIKTGTECATSKSDVYDIIKALFVNDIDYEIVKAEKTIGDTTFNYYEARVIE